MPKETQPSGIEKGKPLSLEINVEVFTRNGIRRTDLSIGNSGLSLIHFDNDPDILYMHFTPDHNIGWDIDEMEMRRNVAIFPGGFYEFYQYWLDTENFPLRPRPGYIEGYTNGRMHTFRLNLFNRTGEIYETTGSIGNSFDYRIDLSKLALCPELIQRLKRFHDRCGHEKFLMKD